MTSNGNSSNVLDPSTGTPRGASSTASTSTVRPRNRRLISLADDSEENESVSTGLSPFPSLATSGRSRSQNATPSPSATRNPSPLPSIHPSRTSPSYSRHDASSPQRSRAGQDRKVSSGFASSFFESSWTSLQELAATMMGSDTSHEGSRNGSLWVNGRQHRRKPSRAADAGSFRTSANKGPSRPSLPSSWGPSGFLGLNPTPGSKEERDALVQAKRREALLLADGDPMFDSRGPYKRRNSREENTVQTQMLEDDCPETLVYVHQVQPNDSLTGVSIRYGCQLGILRKANGFWPSDTIQSRKTVVIPVDACAVKGRPIRPNKTDQSRTPDLMDDESPAASSTLAHTDQPSATSPRSDAGPERGNFSTSSSSTPENKSANASQIWKHECWVQIDGFSEPVELGRVPCKALGYFPRARRKSRSQNKPFSDLEDITSRSSSFAQLEDAPPSSSSSRYIHQNSPSRFRDRSTSSSKSQNHPYRHRRQRSSIALAGPGGVGTLDRNAVGPGPAPDKLNDFINTHLPNLALPPPPTSQPSGATVPPNRPPRISFDSTSSALSNSSSTGLEHVGGALEGWFRKVATRAKSTLNDLQQPSQLSNHLGIGGNGDLIELDDTRESSRTVTPSQSPGPRKISGSAASSSRGLDMQGGSMRGRSINNTWQASRAKDD
ncbi:hypothetical protein VTO42DRAFT_1198 [Malbranchea cinnamomea]